MLALSLWLLAQTPAAPATPDGAQRWLLSVELPRTIDVGGLGPLPLRMRALFLLRGPLSSARAEPCFLVVDSALARARAKGLPGAAEPLRLIEQAGALRSDDARALMPAGPVDFELRAAGLGLSAMSAEVHGRLSLDGRRTRQGAEGDALLHQPSERVFGPAFLRLRFHSGETVRGRFSLVPSAAEHCTELTDPAATGGAP